MKGTLSKGPELRANFPRLGPPQESAFSPRQQAHAGRPSPSCSSSSPAPRGAPPAHEALPTAQSVTHSAQPEKHLFTKLLPKRLPRRAWRVTYLKSPFKHKCAVKNYVFHDWRYSFTFENLRDNQTMEQVLSSCLGSMKDDVNCIAEFNWYHAGCGEAAAALTAGRGAQTAPAHAASTSGGEPLPPPQESHGRFLEKKKRVVQRQVEAKKKAMEKEIALMKLRNGGSEKDMFMARMRT